MHHHLCRLPGRCTLALGLLYLAWGSWCGAPPAAAQSLAVRPAAVLDHPWLTHAHLESAARVRTPRGGSPRACRDPWAMANPLADCTVDPLQPVTTAIGDALQSALSAWVISVCDDLATGLQTVFDWANQPDPANPQSPGVLASTPARDSYNQPVVRGYWEMCRLVANGVLALLVMLAGYEIMMGTRAGRSYDGALDALRRILLAALLANVSLDVMRLVVDLGNALCGLVGGAVGFPTGVTAPGADETIGHAVFRLLYLVVAALVLVQLLVRLALLDLLIILSPLGLLCYASPRAQRWAQLWTQLFVGTALQQVLQLLALHVSSDLLTHLSGTSDDTMVQVLVGCAGLLLVFRLPALLRGVSALGPLPTVAGLATSLGAEWARHDAAQQAQTRAARTPQAIRAGGRP